MQMLGVYVEIEELQQLYQNAYTDLNRLRFDKSHPWHRGLVLFYFSIIEYSDTFIALHLLGKRAAMPMVCRALLEAYIDFKNLHDDPQCGFGLEAAQLKERLDLLRNSKDLDNSYLTGIADFQDQEERWQSEFDDLVSKGHKPLKQWQKFEQADKSHEYRAVYSELCSHSHNNLSSLGQRYLDTKDSDGNFSLVVFDNFEPSETEHLVQLVYICLMDSSARVHRTLSE
jgi:hypothetical protein